MSQEEVKAKKIIDESRKWALEGKRFAELAQTAAWQELVKHWTNLIELQRDEKLATNLSDYAPDAKISFKRADGVDVTLTGSQLLYIRQLDEMRAGIYAEIIGMVEGAVKLGQDAEAKLRKYEELSKTQKHIREQNKGK